MNQFKKLAIACSVSAVMMGATAAEAHLAYNFNASTANGNAAGPWSDGFGPGPGNYTGNLPVTWIANVEALDETFEVSQADAVIEGAAAGYNVETKNNKWNPLHSWGNALDFGLIDLTVTGDLLIEVKADATQSSLFTPGFTLFSGWDTSATSSKHAAWNVNPAAPTTLGATGLTYVGHASTTTAGGMVSAVFSGLSEGHYSLWIGGNNTGEGIGGSTSTGGTGTTNQSYIANITASPVPLPAAVWLFGSALMGFLGLQKRKMTA